MGAGMQDAGRKWTAPRRSSPLCWYTLITYFHAWFKRLQWVDWILGGDEVLTQAISGSPREKVGDFRSLPLLSPLFLPFEHLDYLLHLKRIGENQKDFLMLIFDEKATHPSPVFARDSKFHTNDDHKMRKWICFDQPSSPLYLVAYIRNNHKTLPWWVRLC